MHAHTHTHTCVYIYIYMTTVKYPNWTHCPSCSMPHFQYYCAHSVANPISSSTTSIWLCLLIYSPPFLCLCLACYLSPSFFVSKVNILGSGFILLRFKYWLPLSGYVLGKFCYGGVPSKRDCSRDLPLNDLLWGQKNLRGLSWSLLLSEREGSFDRRSSYFIFLEK